MLVHRKNIPVVTVVEGEPVCPPHFLPEDWQWYLEKGNRLISRLGLDWKTIVEKELVPLPPVKIRLGRNRWVNRIGRADYEAVLNRFKATGNDAPTQSKIARELGITPWALRKYAKKWWNIVLPNSTPDKPNRQNIRKWNRAKQ